MTFQPDYHHMLDVLANKRPLRLPLYEHLINSEFMEILLNLKFTDLLNGNTADRNEFFVHYCRFYKEMTYDTVSFETCITEILPDNGAIMGGKPGPIQNRDDFEKYPWDELSHRFWELAKPRFDALKHCLPRGMKAVGGIGNGVFEISEDLVGFEYLAYMMADDPDLFSALYQRIGDIMLEIWKEFLSRYSDIFVICRFGDDLGFKNSTLLAPDTINKHIIPQYKRIITQIKNNNRPFLWHSCGNIFAIMEDMISTGIDAKHSNEDAISSFEKWITLYGDRIGLLGGIDVDILCMETADSIFQTVKAKGENFRKQANGYALGSGNSIPEYVPVDGYLAMVRAAHHIRENEKEY
jgi:uroporphyrinogen decarboxylase